MSVPGKLRSFVRLYLLPSVITALVNLFYRTVRLRVENAEIRDTLLGRGAGAIYVFWHGRLFPLIAAFRGSGTVIPVSSSEDGKMIAAVLRGFHYDVIMQMPRRGNERALLAMRRKLAEGREVAFAADGPLGPFEHLQMGPVYLAAKTGAPIITVTTSAARGLFFQKAWDRFYIPAPFSEAVVRFDGVFHVPPESNEAEMERYRVAVEKHLRAIGEFADRKTGCSMKRYPEN